MEILFQMASYLHYHDHADIKSVYFNSLAPRKFEWDFRYVIFKQILVIDDCPNMNVTGLHW